MVQEDTCKRVWLYKTLSQHGLVLALVVGILVGLAVAQQTQLFFWVSVILRCVEGHS